MPRQFIANDVQLAGVKPTLDETGSIIDLVIDLSVQYTNVDTNASLGSTETLNVWGLLSQQQKDNLQEIQNVISQEIATNYFA